MNTNIFHVTGFEGRYGITDEWQIWSYPWYANVHWKFLKQKIRKDGYRQVELRLGKNIHKSYLIHRLMADTFLPNPEW